MSLKSILFNVLENAIGDFIVGFTSDHLKLGLWSGKIALNDLKINVEAVKKLGLPIGVVGGSVDSLRLEIPWSRLGSSPVKIFIDGVFLVCKEERSPAQIDPDHVAEKLAALIRARLSAADEKFKVKLRTGDDGQGGEVKQGMVARYVSKIVDNLEVGLRRIHVRFEGSDDLPAIGVTLSSFEVHAVDENWNQAFVERDAYSKAASLLRNLAKLNGLSVYCQFDKRFHEDDRFEEVIESLDSMIALPPSSSDRAKGEEPLLDKAYILRPVDASLRIVRNDKDKPGMPRYRLEFQTGEDNANLAIKSRVVDSILALVKRITLLKRQREMTRLHPAATMGSAARPIKRGFNAKRWWRYAAEFVCPNLEAANRKRTAMNASTLRRLRLRPRYIKLYKAVLESEDKADDKDSPEDVEVSSVAVVDDDEMKEIERDVPVEALVVWRQEVLLARHVKEENAQEEPGFFGRMFGKTKKKVMPSSDKSEDATIDDLREIARKAEEEEARAAPPPKFEMVRAVVRTGCRIAFCDDGDRVLTEFGVELSAFARQTVNGDETDIVAGLGALYLRDSTGLAARSGVLDDHQNILCHEEREKSGIPFESSLVAIQDKFPKLAQDGDASDAVNGGDAPVQLLVSMRPLKTYGKGGKKETSSRRTDVVARSRPFRFAYHAPTIARLIEVFKPPPEDQKALTRASAEKAEDAKKAAAEALEKFRETNNGNDDEQGRKSFVTEDDLVYGFYINAKFGAPTIYLPRSWNEGEGAFVVDTGAVVLYGGIDAIKSRRQSWSFEVKDANIARVDSSNKVLGNVVAPCGISVSAFLTSPEDANPLLTLDIVGTPVSFLLVRSTLRELLELAALLSQGLNPNADIEQRQASVMLEEPEEVLEDADGTEEMKDDKKDDNSIESESGQVVILAERSKQVPSSTAWNNLAFKLNAKFPLLELKVWSKDELAYVATISTLKIDFKVRSAGGMMLNSTLKSIALDDQRAGFSIIESFGSSDAVETSNAALAARDQLSLRDDANDNILADDDKALFSFSVVTDPNAPPPGEDENFYATRIAISFCTLRAKCGAGTLLPLEPLMSELFQGLGAFGGGNDGDSLPNKQPKKNQAAKKEAKEAPPAGLHLVATVGEISAILLDKAGEKAVATASVVGTAVAFSSRRTGTTHAGVRVSELRLQDARAQEDSAALGHLILPKAKGEEANDMLFVADYSDDGHHMDLSGILRPITLYFMPQIIVASVSSVKALLASVSTILSPRSDDERALGQNLAKKTISTIAKESSGEEKMDELSDQESSASSPQNPRLMTMDFRIPEVEAVLARDASKLDSESLLLRVGAQASMRSETYGENQGGEMVAKASMHDLSLLLAKDGTGSGEGASDPFHILDPVEADVAFERRVDGDGDPYNTVVSANLSKLTIRLSYRDIKSILAMVGTIQLREENPEEEDAEGLKPPSAPDMPQSYIEGSSTAKITKVETMAGSLGFSGARLFIVDDTLGPAVPVLDLLIGELDAKIDGPTTNLYGIASCTFAATSFNRESLSYEPLIRKFAVKATIDIVQNVDTGVTTQDLVVSTDQIVEILVSHTFVTDILHLSSRLRAKATDDINFSEGSKVKTKIKRDDPPLFIANETELSLRCRADDQWVHVGPGQRAAVKMRESSARSIEASSLLQAPSAVDVTNDPSDSKTSDFLLSRVVSNAPHRGVKEVSVTDPILSNGVSWHVGFDEASGRVLARFMSRVQVSNRTPISVALACIGETSDEAGTIIEPQSKKRAPLGLAQLGVMLKLRRHDDDGKQSWRWSDSSSELYVWEQASTGEYTNSSRNPTSSTRPSEAVSSALSGKQWKSSGARGASMKKVVTCVGKTPDSRAQHIIYGIQRVPPPAPGAEEARIILAPPILVRSRLPCGMVLTLANATAETRLRVGPGADVGCCDLQVKDGIYLACRIASFGGKCGPKLTTKKAAKKAPPGTGNNYTSDFSGSTPGLYELILRRDGFDSAKGGKNKERDDDDVDNAVKLELRVEKMHRSLGLRITISCPLWIIDNTGLRLGFALNPPNAIDKVSSTLFGSSKSSIRSSSASSRPVETRQRVPSDLLENKVGIWIESQRPHTLKRAPRPGDPLYAEGESSPYVLDSELGEPLASAIRLMTHDAERAGPTSQPAIFKNLTQQHQQRMRRVGFESDAAKARREAPYITIRNDDQRRVLDVYVAVDGRVERTPEWILDSGLFTRAHQIKPVKMRKRAPQMIPSNFFKAPDDSRQYMVWQAAVNPGGGIIDLYPNLDKAMYLVFLSLRERALNLTDDDDDEDDEQRPNLNVSSQNDIAAGDWLESWPGSGWLGKFGSALLSSPDGKKFAINRRGRLSEGWSTVIAAAAATSFSTSMEDGDGGMLELDVVGNPLRGVFANFGTLVHISPRFALWNIDNEFSFCVRQKGSKTEIDARRFKAGQENGIPWHWRDRKLDFKLQFGVEAKDGGEVIWSLASIPIDSIGGFALLTTEDGVVIRIEVSVNTNYTLPPFSGVIVYMSVERPETALFAARNDPSTGADAVFMQGPRLLAKVPPGEERIIGWTKPENLGSIDVMLDRKTRTSVDVNAIRAETPLAKSASLTVAVHVVGGTRYFDVGPKGQLDEPKGGAGNEKSKRSINLRFAGLGLSVVGRDAEKVRRELMYGRVSNFEAVLVTKEKSDEFQLNIRDIQLDNHIPNALWPTFVAAAKRDEDDADLDLISVAAVNARHNDGSSSLQYFAARLLPIDVHTDLASVMTLGSAVGSVPLDMLNAEEALAAHAPAEWTQSLLKYEETLQIEGDLTQAREVALGVRGYIEMLMLHPVEVTVSFEPTATEQDDVNLSAFSYVRSLAAITNACIRLNSFIVERAVETTSNLVTRLRYHYIMQVLSQLLYIVGSFSSIGAPANLVDSVGGGVKEFFYAPAKGIVESPSAFGTGVARGTAGLVGGVVGGVSSSVAGIGNAVGTNLSMLSGDSQYMAEREARRQKFTAGNAGASAGVVAGGTSIARGFAEGIGGIFTQPFEGAKKGGVVGGFTGFAKGVAGVAVKPVVGVLDGVGTVLQGVSQTASNATVVQHVRPPLKLRQIPDSDQDVIDTPMQSRGD